MVKAGLVGALLIQGPFWLQHLWVGCCGRTSVIQGTFDWIPFPSQATNTVKSAFEKQNEDKAQKPMFIL